MMKMIIPDTFQIIEKDGIWGQVSPINVVLVFLIVVR